MGGEGEEVSVHFYVPKQAMKCTDTVHLSC